MKEFKETVTEVMRVLIDKYVSIKADEIIRANCVDTDFEAMENQVLALGRNFSIEGDTNVINSIRPAYYFGSPCLLVEFKKSSKFFEQYFIEG